MTRASSTRASAARAMALIALLAAAACGDSGGGDGETTGEPGSGSSSHGSSSSTSSGGSDTSETSLEDATASVTDGKAGATDATADGKGPATGPGEDGAVGTVDSSTGATGNDGSVTNQDASVGVDAATGGVDAGHVPDASTAGGADAAADSSTTSACVASLPAGWSLISYNTGIDSCPAGFTEHVVFGTPAVAAGACSCTCAVGQAGSCGEGSLAMSTNPGHGNDACTTPWFTATVNGNQCIAVPSAQQGALGNFEASPLPASGQGGTCTSTAHTTTSALSEPTQRYCDVPAASANAVCNGTPPAGFSACIVANGAVACPASTPFVHPFTVEDGATLACGACSACSVATTCANPTLSAFTNANCTGTPALSFAVSGACETNPNEQTVLSIEYSSTATATCTSGASATSVSLTGPHTICCR